MKSTSRSRVLLTTSLLALLSMSAVCQGQSFPAGRFNIGPYPVACGPNVVTVLQTGLGDAARAIPGTQVSPPAILLDPMILGQAPIPVQLFVYAHECAHHVIGVNESAADCWAARLGRQQRWFDLQTMQFLVQAFQWNPGDWTHAPGPIRLQNIWNCFNS